MSSENRPEINVLMLVASLPPMSAGGAEMQALRLAETLTKKGIKVSFITPGNSKCNGIGSIQNMPVYRMHSWINGIFEKLSAAKKKNKVPISQIEFDDKNETTDKISRKVGLPTLVYYNIFFAHSLLFLRRNRISIDIIHAHTMEWSAIVAARLGKALKKPVIIKDSTMNGFQSLARFPSGHSLQKMIIENGHFIAMTKIINENLLKEGIPDERISKIPNGIVVRDIEGHHTEKKKQAKILFVGNLYQQPAKGIDILLRAFQMVHARFPTAILQIVGDGVTESYHAFVKQLSLDSSIEFCGKQSDLSGFYREADLFVLPSRREGMSNALMEAMLNSVPCVATDISGSQDLITNKVNGILVPAANTSALADGICFILEHPEIANEMGKKGRDTILREFDMEIIANEYISLYRKLLEEKK